MLVLRAGALFLLLIVFVVVGCPLQLAIGALFPRARSILPLILCKSLCALMRINVQRLGEMEARRPLLIVPNHISWLDIVVIGSTGFACFLAKKEVRSWPLLGLLARVQGAVFVDRTRRMAIPQVNREIATRMAAGDPVILFAEATTGDGTRLLKFHSSHFEAARDILRSRPDLPETLVQPVIVDYRRRNGLLLGRAGRADMAWYGDKGFAPHLWEILKGGPVDCLVQFVPAQAVTLAETRKIMAKNVEITIRRERWQDRRQIRGQEPRQQSRQQSRHEPMQEPQLAERGSHAG
ncbi:lysophospholipid acyltransferase family protein [Roseiarcaceae bacterium H3SJ34-1]|uniref:lysophospholipid acyltransferase family protein n=1 Tax=Terripilifer ovatus TaxID=3032367 RepID=UPI003AB94632|nr:lysophospholipid acyltransferase family protein [Roseiarcaceae bacterium H3SJ34-1]